MARAAARRREPRAPKRKLRRKLPRAARYAKAIQPPDGPALAYRLVMRRAIAKWWDSIGSQALRLAKQIGKSDDDARADANEESHDADIHLTGHDDVATNYVSQQIGGIARQVERHSDAQFKRIGIKLSDAAPGVAKLVPGWRKENVGLVRSMLKSEQTKLEDLLSDGAGRRVESLSKDIKDRFGITQRHAELIARNQTSRLNSKISHERAKSAGIQRGAWTCAGDERVRESHDEMDGNEFDLDDPPNVDGEDVLPGEPPNCRCVTYYLIPELDDADDVAPPPEEEEQPDQEVPAEAAEVEPEPITEEEVAATEAAFEQKTQEATTYLEGHPGLEAVRDYTGETYTDVNGALRGEVDLSTPEGREFMAAQLDAAEKIEQTLKDAEAAGHAIDGIVFRGLRASPTLLDSLLTQDEHTFAAFSSTTIRKGLALTFAAGGQDTEMVLLRLRQRSAVPVSGVSEVPVEQEALLRPGLKFRVIARTTEQTGYGLAHVLDLEQL